MTTHPFTPQLPLPDLFPGQAVHVNARCAWLPATVVSVAHQAVGISLSTATAGTLTRTVAPWVVQPADGYRLAPVHDLRHGDEVVAADGGIHTVAGTPWQGRDGWWVITYTNGQRATLPSAAVLRLPDHTPAVTVNGAALTHPAIGATTTGTAAAGGGLRRSDRALSSSSPHAATGVRGAQPPTGVPRTNRAGQRLAHQTGTPRGWRHTTATAWPIRPATP